MTSNKLNAAPKAEAADKAFNVEEALKEFKTKSALIRSLSAQGKSRSEIAKMLNIRYQHVRNVLTAPVKQTPAK